MSTTLSLAAATADSQFIEDQADMKISTNGFNGKSENAMSKNFRTAAGVISSTTTNSVLPRESQPHNDNNNNVSIQASKPHVDSIKIIPIPEELSPNVEKELSSFFGRKNLNHKDPSNCSCLHCMILRIPNLLDEIKIDVAAVSYDASTTSDLFGYLPEIRMRLNGRYQHPTNANITEPDNVLNNNISSTEGQADRNGNRHQLLDLDALDDDEDDRHWDLYEGLDNFVEEWGDHRRQGFSCGDSIINAMSTGFGWTFRNLRELWRKIKALRKVAPEIDQNPQDQWENEVEDPHEITFMVTEGESIYKSREDLHKKPPPS